MAATYNNGGDHSLNPLRPGNSQTMGSATTSATGNTVRVLVVPLQVRRSTFGPPGGQFVAERRSGYLPRTVVWNWRIRCASDSPLNAIERIIDQYIDDGREHALADGFGRSTTSAVVVPDGTQRIGPRFSHPDGGRSQVWRVVFAVLNPKIGANQL